MSTIAGRTATSSCARAFSGTAASITLQAVGLTLTMAEVYDGLDIGPGPSADAPNPG
jgi:hypothetical protein